MPATAPAPESLRGFVLGTLPYEEAERIVVWLHETPGAAAVLEKVSARDTLCDLLSTINEATPSPDAIADRVIRLAETSRTNTPPVDGTMPESGTPPDSAAPESAVPPPWYGDYRIVRKLGQGGMGIVYEAADKRLRDRRVAIKVLLPRLAADAVSRQRFLREAESAAAIDSDHAVRILHVAEADKSPYIVMEYIDGQTLEDWITSRTQPVTATDVMWVARDLLAGLAAAHAKGLIHRDIKPHNAMVETKTGRLKLLDFGLTRTTEPEAGLTLDGRVVGTPAYMAPEQAAGTPLDPKCDLFSVGLVLYRVVAGYSPCRMGLPVDATGVKIATVPPLTGLPAEVITFIAALMAHDPDARPKSAQAALDEAKAITNRLTAKPATQPPQPPQPRRRLLIAAGLAALVATVALAVIIIVRDKDRKELARITIPDDLAKKGSIEVKADGKSVTIGLEKGAEKPLAKTPGPLPPAKDKRVVVTDNTFAFADEFTDAKALEVGLVNKGTKGTLIEVSKTSNRYKIRLDHPPGVEVWIDDICLKRAE